MRGKVEIIGRESSQENTFLLDFRSDVSTDNREQRINEDTYNNVFLKKQSIALVPSQKANMDRVVKIESTLEIQRNNRISYICWRNNFLRFDAVRATRSDEI